MNIPIRARRDSHPPTPRIGAAQNAGAVTRLPHRRRPRTNLFPLPTILAAVVLAAVAGYLLVQTGCIQQIVFGGNHYYGPQGVATSQPAPGDDVDSSPVFPWIEGEQ